MSKRWLVLAVMFLCGFIYTYRLDRSFVVDTDFARDMYEVSRLVLRRPTLIGPMLSVGVPSGPYYYYLLAPILLISGFSTSFLLSVNAWVFVLPLAFIAYSLRNKFGLLVTLVVGVSPLFIHTARQPGNGYTYLPLLVFWIWYVLYKRLLSSFNLLALGFLAGLLLNFHPANSVVIFPLAFFILVKDRPGVKILYFVLGIFVTLLPLILFEHKNNFVITKGLLGGTSQNFFSQALDNPGQYRGRETLGHNLLFIFGQIEKYTAINPAILIPIGLIISYLARPRQHFMLGGLVFVSLAMPAILLRSKFEIQYLIPTAALLISWLALVLSNFKYGQILLFLLGIVFLVNFPKEKFSESTRRMSIFEGAVDYLISSRVVEKNERFNLMGIIGSSKYVVNGNEYRFAFMKHRIDAAQVWDYKSVDSLLVFSEIPLQLSDLDTWETDQFDLSRSTFQEKYFVNDLEIYKISRVPAKDD